MGFAVDEFPYSSEYDSDLRSVLKEIRRVMDTLKTYDDVIAEVKAELAKISDLYTRVDTLEKATSDLGEIRQNITNLTKGLLDLGNKEKADIDILQREIDSVKDSMAQFENDIKNVYSYINYNLALRDRTIQKNYEFLLKTISDLNVELSNQIDYIIWRLDQIDTSVLNPWHTTEGRINQDKNAKHIYADLADGCLTAAQYAELGLTAEEYFKYELSAIDYAKHSKEKLHYYWVYSPVYGWRQDINVVLTSILNACKNTMTAQRYSELNLTADDYSELGLSAYDYYSYNPAKTGIYVEDGVLKSDHRHYIQVVDGVLKFTGINAIVDGDLLKFEKFG